MPAANQSSAPVVVVPPGNGDEAVSSGSGLRVRAVGLYGPGPIAHTVGGAEEDEHPTWEASMRAGRLMLGAVMVSVGILPGACGGNDDTASGADTSTSPPTTTTTAAIAEAQKDLVYGTWEDLTLTLDMQTPDEPAGAPVVIHLPGKGGDDTPPRLVEDLAEEGAIVFVVQYPLVTISSWDDPDEVILGNHGAGARAMAEGVACAIRFARAQASELGSDDPVVMLSGFSLGGGIAAHVALFGAALDARWDENAAEGGPPRQVDCEVTEGSTRVDALVGMDGAYDFFVPIYVEQWERGNQQLWEFLSNPSGPNPNLTIRLLHGEDSRLSTESVGLAAALKDASYNVGELVVWEGGHAVPTDLAIATIMEVLGQ